MIKKPHYTKSAVAFLVIGVILLMIALEIVVDFNWLFPTIIVLAILLAIYAIASYIYIEPKK